MIINGIRLTPIDAYKARKLPENTILIVARYYRDFKTYAITERHYYRARLVRRKTIAGMDESIVSEPDCNWPEIPPWHRGWIWLTIIDGFLEYFIIDH